MLNIQKPIVLFFSAWWPGGLKLTLPFYPSCTFTPLKLKHLFYNLTRDVNGRDKISNSVYPGQTALKKQSDQGLHCLLR